MFTIFKQFYLSLLALTTFFLLQLPTHARDLTVSATAPGAYRSIQSAINAAQPGDVIKLEPKAAPYNETVVFRNKSGTVEQPIILDGQGATLNGSQPLKAAEWEKTETGAYRSTSFWENNKLANSAVGRFYFIMNDSANRMGRSAKGNSGRFKAVADLKPGEWTYDVKEKIFYILPPTGQSIEDVRAPLRSNGVAINGDCENLVIRNITATHVWNDGFNIHGRSRNIRFENISAVECGDDGISAHGDCHISVDGFVSRRNSTGMCHINQSQSDNRNLTLEDNLGYSIYLLDDSKHTIKDTVVRSTRGTAFHATRKTEVTMSDVLFIGETLEQVGLLVNADAQVTARNISIWNLPLTIEGAAMRLQDSVIGGKENSFHIAPTASWNADNNLWDVSEIKHDSVVYQRNSFPAYVRASGQDIKSRWEDVTLAELVKGQFAPIGIRFQAKFPIAE